MMIISGKEISSAEFSDKIMAGINKALMQMLERTAKQDDDVVISDGKGNPRSVPAKELLKQLQK